MKSSKHRDNHEVRRERAQEESNPHWPSIMAGRGGDESGGGGGRNACNRGEGRRKGRRKKEGSVRNWARAPRRGWALLSKERTRNIPYPLQLPNNSNVGPDSGPKGTRN